ncbi:MAG: HU family DNA-binding protein [Treponema sp.]|nr:HU family DNA-binding protein [Treponema sp.]
MSEFLTSSGLAVRLVEKTGIKLETAKQFSTLFFTIVRKGLKNSESFSVYNFGTFKKTWIEATVGLNPGTGEKINIPAHWRIKFVPCASVARRINKPYEHLKAKELPEDEPEVIDSEPESVIPEPVIQDEDEPEEKEYKTSIGYDEKKGLLKRAIELSEKDDEDDEILEEKRPVKLFVILGLGILFLILLLSLLLKSCAPKKSVKKAEIKKSEQPVKSEETESPALEPEKEEVKEELIVETEEIDAALLFESYSVPNGSDYHTIAEEKYGNRHLWPILYAANKDSKPDPDLIGAYYRIKVPSILKGEAFKKQIEGGVMAAYNGYLLMCEKQPESSKNKERERLAIRVLVSGELMSPGFIDSHAKRILPEYAEMARNIVKNQYL